jgi:hypothetical protein
MSNELSALAQALGKPAPGVYDPLSEHSDLQQRVNDGEISTEDAHELASARAARALSQTHQQQQQQQADDQQEIQTALADVRRLGEQLQLADPSFAAKMPYMEPIVTAAVKSGAPPSQWRAMIESAYNGLPAMPAVATPTESKVSNAPDPLRPTGPGPSQANLEKEPNSIFEAVSQSLERGY